MKASARGLCGLWPPPCGHLVGAALEAGVLLNVTRDNVVRLLPALTMTDEEADELVERVARVING